MRILTLNHEFPPLGGGGGRVCFEIARRLVDLGHAVTVVTTRYRDLPEHECIKGIEIHRVYGRRKSELHNNVPVTMGSFLTLGARQALRCLRHTSFDLIHAYFTIPAGIVGIYLKRKTGLPLIVSPHGSDVPHHNPEKFNLPVRLLAPVISHVWHRADRIVTVSDSLRQTAWRTAPDVAIDVIHNGIDIGHFTQSANPPDNAIPQILAVGRLVELKGIHHLLEALGRLKQQGMRFYLSIVGEGPERSRLDSLVMQLDLSDHVCFLGQVPYQHLPEYYHRSDLFALPSLAESFGQVFVEAMACGLPVIGSTTGGIPEVVGPHQRPWLIKPGDVDTLANHIAEMLQNPALRRQLGRRNAEEAQTRFAWQQVVARYMTCYEDVVLADRRRALPHIA